MSRRGFVSFFSGIFRGKILVLGLVAASFIVGSLIFFKYFKIWAQSTTPEGVVVSQSEQRCLCGVKGDQAIYTPLTYLPEASGGQIVFNSRSGHKVDVAPVFYTTDGNQITGNTVSIEPNEIRYVNIKKLIPPEYRKQTNWSGLSLRYYGTNREIWAQFRFLALNGGNNVDEFFTVESESHAVNQAATWWTPAQSTSVIVLGNITGSPTSASLKFGSGENQEVEIPAFNTKIIKKRNTGKISAESVLIKTTGPAGSIIPTGLIETANHNSNSVIRFYDVNRVKQPNLYANGLSLENVKAHLVLSNTSESPVRATPKFISKSGTDVIPAITLPTVTLNGLETKEVDLDKLFSAVNNNSDFDVVSVEIDSESPNGSLIGAIYTRDKGNGLTYDIPLRDSGPARNMTGAYPWKVDSQYSTLVYITNITDIKQNFVGQINFPGGHLAMRPRTLAPGETAIIDFRKLRDAAFADDLGNVIPKNITQGQYMWSTRGRTGGKMALIGRAVMKSVSDGIATSYSCPNYCPASYTGYVTINSNNIDVDDTVTATAWEISTYMGSTSGAYEVPAEWSSGDNLSPNGPSWDYSQTFTGVGAGGDFITAWMGDYEHYTEYFTDDVQCMDDNYGYTIGDYKTVDVKPKISDLSPERSVVNREVNVTITGKGFAAGATVQVSGAGVTVSNVSVVSPTQVTAKFTTASNGAQGERDVTVTVNGKTSNTKKFRVQIPYQLEVVVDTGNLAVVNCPTVKGRMITYKIVDSDGKEIRQAISVEESFSGQTTNSCNNGPPTPASCDVTTIGNVYYQFTDGIAITDSNCSTVAVQACQANPSCGYEHTQKWATCSTDGNIQLTSVSGITHCNEIKVNNSLQFTMGTRLPR